MNHYRKMRNLMPNKKEENLPGEFVNLSKKSVNLPKKCVDLSCKCDLASECVCTVEAHLSNIENNGFRGTPQTNYKRFCEELYATLYSSKNGYEDTAALLLDLYNRSNINGIEISRINGFSAFELFIKCKLLERVVSFEKTGNPYSFCYSARLNSEFDHIRRAIVPKKLKY